MCCKISNSSSSISSNYVCATINDHCNSLTQAWDNTRLVCVDKLPTNSGLDAGTIAGIVVGCCVGVCLICCATLLAIRYVKKGKSDTFEERQIGNLCAVGIEIISDCLHKALDLYSM
ncbi:hypothetical protein C9374_013780 [Naegleria lovaniensis]|uniref:Transmembrane protein n=1 Tax=Naegleria lovaniensis TaxID=51637 RepID=A0AA88KBG6_NAELO|nr:uncharacterized protein C9374_013780 [Naegleria lovaniensis]KAG2370869.1 hypothetical protein C9374_013780 [Naegleria lovaniensis]